MAANGRGGFHSRTQYSSSPSQLSSPPSGISEPGSPSRHGPGRANISMGDEIIVDTAAAAAAAASAGPRFSVMQQNPQQVLSDVPLTAAGVPRKKPGRKPGSTVKPKNPDGTPEAPKQRRPRKPRDPSAPPIQRKRKLGVSSDGADEQEDSKASPAAPSRQPKITELTSMRMDIDSRPSSATPHHQPFSQSAPKRESFPGSMQSILNVDPPPPAPTRTSGQSYDPIRSSTYDPVRETMMSRDPYGTGPLGSPRAPNQTTNRASASPSIASLVDPPSSKPVGSPSQSHQSAMYNSTAQSRLQEPTSIPPSPSNVVRTVSASSAAPKSTTTTTETRKPTQPSAHVASKLADLVKASNITTISDGSVAPSRKVASVLQQGRKHKNASTASSSPRLDSLKDVDLPGVDSERSILDFGKVSPGEVLAAPSIVLHIPLNGETNKYVNFMRLAEERYGWDALHPRLAAHRDRKARIAAATAALEKTGSGRESGDEMSVDLQSGDEGSDKEMGGMGTAGKDGKDGGGASGADKPKKKKRNFKEDEYDKDDGFVDDSEMLWEEQAAASRDGFFVYSGPLVPEVEKPAAGYVFLIPVPVYDDATVQIS